jgi:hypothetical protein
MGTEVLSSELEDDGKSERGEGSRFEARGIRNFEPRTSAYAWHDAPAHLALPAFPARRARPARLFSSFLLDGQPRDSAQLFF